MIKLHENSCDYIILTDGKFVLVQLKTVSLAGTSTEVVSEGWAKSI